MFPSEMKDKQKGFEKYLAEAEENLNKLEDAEKRNNGGMTLGQLKAKLNSLLVSDDTQVFLYLDEQSSLMRDIQVFEYGSDIAEELYNKADWYDVVNDMPAIVIKGDTY